jgi:hypothetical protein
MNRKILVIGVGNEYRGDDGIGILLAREIAKKSLDDVIVAEEAGEGTSLMSCWETYDRVILIDAVRQANEPGKIIGLPLFITHILEGAFAFTCPGGQCQGDAVSEFPKPRRLG